MQLHCKITFFVILNSICIITKLCTFPELYKKVSSVCVFKCSFNEYTCFNRYYFFIVSKIFHISKYISVHPLFSHYVHCCKNASSLFQFIQIIDKYVMSPFSKQSLHRNQINNILIPVQLSPCERCRCEVNREVYCTISGCPALHCVNPVFEPNHCCPVCKSGESPYTTTLHVHGTLEHSLFSFSVIFRHCNVLLT